ncbi:Linear gramicidin synthase subunit D [Mycobacterium marinum]|uniref:thioester reductase domain-containing protein n=1 Tax=Mycobacterium marinum TaxID=1781 RepID=UPI000E3D92B7|nr:thioester reductase domain-containing protein [Mycobacterium marinum]RFZ49476.1 Linear gramicidin synthase subunit D [Mycobacterium marinum]
MFKEDVDFVASGGNTTTVRSLETFRDWLRHEIAKSSDAGFTGVDFSRSLADLGFSSVHTVRLAGELEKLLEIDIEPTLLAEFESIDAMCVTLFRMREGMRNRDTNAPYVQTVRVAASFTAELIEPTVCNLLGRLGMPANVQFAGYNQVFQALLNPEGVFAGEGGINVVLMRVEDLFRHHNTPPGREELERAVAELCDALLGHADRSGAPTLVALAPHSPHSVRALGLAELLEDLDQRIIAAAGSHPSLFPVDLRRVYEDWPVVRIWDEARDSLGHLPFTQGCFSAIGACIARRIAAVLSEPAKVIVLDCDNTLWGGVVGEDGPEGITLSEHFLVLQRFMVAQAEAGKLLCIVSKNNDADVLAAFAAHPDMPLGLEHICLRRINWLPKSENMRLLADELGLGLDTFIFIDDSAMEVAEVSEALPQVLAIELPQPECFESFLNHHWAFDAARTTEEDRSRTAMMRQSVQRAEIEASAPTIDDFLSRLDLEIDLAPLSLEDELARAAQLTHRTNQFNARKRSMSEAELRAFCREPGRRTWRARVSDRFGDYGFVGLVSAVSRDSALVCDLFLMSCRVLGRRVEQALVRRLAVDASEAGCDQLLLELETSARNVPVRSFYDSLAGVSVPAGGGDVQKIILEVADIEAHLLASTRVILREETDPARDESAPVPSRSGARTRAAGGYAEIARIGSNVDALMTALAVTAHARRPALATPYVTPRDSQEKAIARIWCDVLGIDRVGVNDNFYELGGDSLRAAEAFARMWDMGVAESISLQTIIEPTVAVLAQAIRDVEAGRAPQLLADSFSLKEEGHLAADICRPGYDPSTYDRPMHHILLTGGTGYLGAYLIRELLIQTEARISCLVRASTPEEGRQRILNNLCRYGLWDVTFESRVDVVLGDLTAPWLGLDGLAPFQALARSIDTIVHSAAWVNFVYPYQHLKATNVESTETILRLAVSSEAPIQVHFVSTLGVIMSTGYGRHSVVQDREAITHCDDLLNGYEQTKYVSDVMMWQAFTERGIPGAIYRPGMVSGLSDGTYHKLDEFLPQFLKGCIQLGAWPLLDTTWEMAPVDFTSKAIVHIAKRPQNLNQAYFVVHPRSRQVSDYIDWHREVGYDIRGLPWDVWKRELLGLGTEGLRKNALFPFVDFIRALSEEQVFFPPTGRALFDSATADLDFDVPDQLELLARYTRHFVACDYYDQLPSNPRAGLSDEPALVLHPPGESGQALDDRLRFDGVQLDFVETYYVLFNDPVRGLSFMARYVLHNGFLESDKLAEVWSTFRDRQRPGTELAIRQRYPLGHARLENSAKVRLEIGPSGYGEEKVWGRVDSADGVIEWDLELDRSEAIALDRLPEASAYDLFPHFQSNGARQHLRGVVTVCGQTYEIGRTVASDGHYWNTKNLRESAWVHGANFEGDPDFLIEGFGARFNDWSQTSLWLTFSYKGECIESNLIDAFHHNRELDSATDSWDFVAERGDLRFVVRVKADPARMLLSVRPLPGDEYVYTHFTDEADVTIDIEQRSGRGWWKNDQRIARGTAVFESTRKVRNPGATREFRIVRGKC